MRKEYMKEIRTVDYDKRNDILYVIFYNEKGNSYCEEIMNGIEEMKDMDTEEVTGYMVYYPCRKQKERQKELDEIGLMMDLTKFCR